MLGLRKFLDQLKQVPDDKPVEPELKAEKKERDRKIKEEQDLAAGVILEATVSEGEGTDTPQDGDLVYVHYSIHSTDDDLLYSTWADEGGSGQPFAFIIGKGWRGPRAWELALLGMTRNMRKRLKVRPSYGYQHPTCQIQPPAGVQGSDVLNFELQLVNWYPQDQIRSCGEDSNVFKRVLHDSDKWEVARAPNEVSISLEARTPAYDGSQCTGYKYHSISPSQPLQVQLGQQLLPPGLELAISNMSKGEKAVFVVPVQLLTSSASDVDDAEANSSSSRGDYDRQQQGCAMVPTPPAKAVQVELCIELHDLMQVRDMTGDGAVTKKRLREGHGEFPVDCPLHDTTVQLHYRVRSLAGGRPGPWVFDSLHSSSSGGSSDVTAGAGEGSTADSSDWGAAASAACAAAAAGEDATGSSTQSPASSLIGGVTADTGCGELPEGLEMCVKLMVPGEVASACCQPKYAYQGRCDAPAGLDPSGPVEFQVLLLSFEREGYWQNMSWEQRWTLADRLKEKGNALFKDKKYTAASNRYTHLLRLIESTRDFETQEQVDKADGYKSTLLSNLALVSFQQEEYARCVEWCDKALNQEPDNAKVVFRKGKALSMKGDHDEAAWWLDAAAQLEPSIAAEVEAAKAANAQRAKAAAQKQKQQFKNFFSKG